MGRFSKESRPFFVCAPARTLLIAMGADGPARWVKEARFARSISALDVSPAGRILVSLNSGGCSYVKLFGPNGEDRGVDGSSDDGCTSLGTVQTLSVAVSDDQAIFIAVEADDQEGFARAFGKQKRASTLRSSGDPLRTSGEG